MTTKNPKRLPFSADMVRQWRANRKTQTRRVVQHHAPVIEVSELQNNNGKNTTVAIIQSGLDGHFSRQYMFLYGVVGDTLSIAEPLIKSDDGYVHYAADNYPVMMWGDRRKWGWKPNKLAARYCPNDCIRTCTKIEALKVEPLGEMTEEDALAEGVNSLEDFKILWNKLNAPRGYPWKPDQLVWVATIAPYSAAIEFDRIPVAIKPDTALFDYSHE